MALTAPGIYSALMGNQDAGIFGFDGLLFPAMAQGISLAVAEWAVSNPPNLALTGGAVGTVGSGVIQPATSKILVPFSPILLINSLTGAGFNGPLQSSLAMVVSAGISQVFSGSAQYAGVSGGVGAGQDVSKVTVANAATLSALLQAHLISTMGNGVLVPSLSIGLGNGISALLLQGTGTGTVTGPTGPAPASGATYSVVV